MYKIFIFYLFSIFLNFLVSIKNRKQEIDMKFDVEASLHKISCVDKLFIFSLFLYSISSW